MLVGWGHYLFDGIFHLVFLFAGVGFGDEGVVGGDDVESGDGDEDGGYADGGFGDDIDVADDDLFVIGLFDGEEEFEFVVGEVGGLMFAVGGIFNHGCVYNIKAYKVK